MSRFSNLKVPSSVRYAVVVRCTRVGIDYGSLCAWQVLKFIDAHSAKDSVNPGWIDRLQNVKSLHTDPSPAYYYMRFHASLFVPLLVLTKIPAAHVVYNSACSSNGVGSCLGCALEQEQVKWIQARVARGKLDPAVARDDTITFLTLPGKMNRYATAVAPLLAAIPPVFAAQLAKLMGISVMDEGTSTGAADFATQSLFGAVWRRAAVPKSAKLEAAVEARPMGHPETRIT